MKAYPVAVLTIMLISGCTNFSSPAERVGYLSAKQDGISKDVYANLMRSDVKPAIANVLAKDDTSLVCFNKSLDEAVSQIHDHIMKCVMERSAERPINIKSKDVQKYMVDDTACGSERFSAENVSLINIENIPNKYVGSCRALRDRYAKAH